MAVAIASNLGIHVGGNPLFADVSFKLERRERMTLSGRNGAGKSTLLRILAGELTPDSGGLSLEKGARVALHDQRPPRDSEMTLGDYVFSGRAEVIALEERLAGLERAMSGGDHSEETMGAYADAQARLDLAGGYRWRDQVLAVLAGLGFAAEHSVSGRVIWCDGDHVGVSFDEGIDVAEVLAELSRKEVDGKLNRPLRLPISAALELVIDKRTISAQLQDISQRGIKILTSSVRSGEELTVQLQGLAQRKAVVRWTDPASARPEPNRRGRPSGSRALDEYLAAEYRLDGRFGAYDVLVPRDR